MAKKKADNVPQLLKDMRWVYEHPWRGGETEGRLACRQFLKDDPQKFLAQLSSLEKAQPPEPPEVEEKKKPMDEGSQRCLDIYEEWLREWEAEYGRMAENADA